MVRNAPAPVDAASGRSPNRHNQELGRKGEELACEHLSARGLVVLSRNWRCRHGELDIVATDGRKLVVCEVKTRSGTGFGAPVEAVTEVKRRRIRRLANAWLAHYRVASCDIRLDVISVLWPPDGAPVLEHFEGAF